METIVVPLDGSPLAKQILPYARALAAAFSARLHLLRVWDLDKQFLTSEYRYAKQLLNEEALELGQQGLDVTTDIGYGTPAEAIVEAAHHMKAKMIAMVTHGYTGIKRWSLGSVTDKVVQATSIPVFVVRSSTKPLSAYTYAIRRILVPLDGSKLAQQALHCAIQLAAHAQADIHLLHVVPLKDAPYAVEGVNSSLGQQRDEALADMCYLAEAEIEQLTDEIQPGTMKVSWHVCIGYPAEKIIQEALLQESDLIVMSTHGYSGLRSWFLGSVADKVLHAATTPLVLVHAAEDTHLHLATCFDMSSISLVSK